jgi:hypothetical protein
VVGDVPRRLGDLPFQPFVEDERASRPIGWKFQPIAEDERSSRPIGWEFQPFMEDDRSSAAISWGCGRSSIADAVARVRATRTAPAYPTTLASPAAGFRADAIPGCCSR